MSDNPIRFDDGEKYDNSMGVWSRLVGQVFLDWLAPAPKLSWIDIGCGSGAFTKQIAELCGPSDLHGVDPSEGQLAFARTRPMPTPASFVNGDAMALPFDAGRFDAAVMALVLFFVPEPARGLAEMIRVTKPGGLVSAYVWDVPGGGLPMAPVQAGMRALGLEPPRPPSADISEMANLRSLWRDAGLADIETREIAATRTFPDFEAYWANTLQIANLGGAIERLEAKERESLKADTRGRLQGDRNGHVTLTARANAIKARVPA